MKIRLIIIHLVLIMAFGLSLLSCTPNKTASFSQTASAQQTTAVKYGALPLITIPAEKVHHSAIAGSWYPTDPKELQAMIDGFLNEVTPIEGDPIGLIVPHAGYVYSGLVAAAGFKQLAGKDYQVAVIIAADHQAPVSNPISVWAEGGFETPLGVVPVNEEIAKALIAASPIISFDRAAHENEHPIEIELPFLQRVCPTCSIVPILMGTDDDNTVQTLANALLSVLPDRRVVVIASSDLSHYPSAEDSKRVDKATLDAIETGDPQQVRQVIQQQMSSGIPNLETCACGEGPILVVMNVVRGLGADTITRLRTANSADSPYGNPEQVVGYGAVMFWHNPAPSLSQEEQQQLLELARSAISGYLDKGVAPNFQTSNTVLARQAGVFVTLTKGGELRGCIGMLEGDQPLYKTVQEMAVAAATSDPRFMPVKKEEMQTIKIEISILSPLRKLDNIDQIRVGTDGLVLVMSGHQGVFLPQVPVEQGWNRDAYLDNLCGKAGLPENCWKDHPALYAFTAEVFGEK
jgi:AmmeMemoRadiSam system protein B/AmmeMemoRadiSam system protein A